MEYRRLGASGVRVSEIGLGSWLTYGGGVEADQAKACVVRAYELRVNFFDTADVYGPGAGGEGMRPRRPPCRRSAPDYLDRYHGHRYDDETPLEETLRALDDLVRQGKVHYVGVSEWTAAQIGDALGLADDLGLDPLGAHQHRDAQRGG